MPRASWCDWLNSGFHRWAGQSARHAAGWRHRDVAIAIAIAIAIDDACLTGMACSVAAALDAARGRNS
ncbi:hypothetical protein H2O77_15270 [Cobetia sp. 4B]|uniref:hypothetical protein n=1 Tax=Cobetia sp. 4B TaxID=2758724 RepID=UPI001C045C2D|nr:hypothetical protein [Cobetia sp. 4B]MBR9755740.1 hypothetical protein [Gammaproteobacteria bacterium]QWN36552.1 hypothetical protein H2O77_15270 [Cobetia sp. 4B]